MFKLPAKLTRHNIPTRTVVFPTELYGHIIDFVFSRSDLFSLCLVCRHFYYYAKGALYHSVDLAHDHLLIQKWFTLIASSPHLAHLVRSLTFGLVYADLPTPSARWLSVIERGLDALTELIELNVDLRASSNTTLPPSSTNIILGRPFRLRVFRNTMFDLARVLPFLESQPDIVVWHQPTAKFCNLPPNFLPKLSRAALPSWLVDELATRKLTELSTAVNAMGVDAELTFLNTLTPFSLTLNRLCLQRQVFGVSVTLREFLLHLAERLPGLEHLSLWNRGELPTDSLAQETASALAHFPRLQTLSILPPRALNKDSFYHDTLASGATTAAYLFRTLNSLHRVAFPAKIPPPEPLWYAKSLNVARAGDRIVGTSKRKRTFRMPSLGKTK